MKTYPTEESQFRLGLFTADFNLAASEVQFRANAEFPIQFARLLPVVRVLYISMFASVLWPPWLIRPQSLVPVTSRSPVLSILEVINDIADKYFGQTPDRNDSSPVYK